MLKLKATLFALALAGLAVTAPDGGALAQSKPTVGIAMPTKSSARWIDDGNNIVKVLKERGYGTDLQYAEDDIPNQLSQIENMVTKGAKVLVIAAIDGTTLSDVLKQAKAKGITVIAYDRLIRNTPDVDYYATFDNFQVGVLQAQSIEQGLGLKEGKGPFNIELFGGSPDDNNAYFFYNGAMSVLQPYIDSGKLVVVSPARWAWTRSQRCAGTVRPPRPAWTICSAPSTAGSASMPCCRPMTAFPSVSSPRSRASAMAARDQPMPVHQRAGCRSALDQGDAARRAIFDHLQGHARPRQGHRGHGRRGARRQGGRRSTTPRPTTTASRSCRPICSSLSWSTRAIGRRPLIDSGYYNKRSSIRTSSSSGRPDGSAPATIERMCRSLSRCAVSARALPGVQALRDVNFTVEAGRDPRARRRKRCRQIDADEGAQRRLSARQL